MPQSTAPYPGQELTEDMRRAVLVEEQLVPGPADEPDVRVLLYRSREATGTLPLVVECHGGAFRMRADNFPAIDARIAMLGAQVVSVDYRSVPDACFPAAPEDCYAALCWGVSSLDIDRSRVVVTGGSAGGALAAAVALMARDRGGPRIVLQALNVPVLDDRCITTSMQQFEEAAIFGAAQARQMWDAYLGAQADRSAVSPYAAPARAQDLSGLPPAFIQVGGLDPLRDEGIDYALRLMAANVPVELYCAPGQYHGLSEDPRTAAHSQALYHDAIAAAIA
jgi:acetyl esterase